MALKMVSSHNVCFIKNRQCFVEAGFRAKLLYGYGYACNMCCTNNLSFKNYKNQNTCSKNFTCSAR